MGRPSEDQRKELKYIGIAFIILGLLSLITNIIRQKFELTILGFCVIFMILGFVLFKFSGKIEDYRKRKRDDFLKK